MASGIGGVGQESWSDSYFPGEEETSSPNIEAGAASSSPEAGASQQELKIQKNHVVWVVKGVVVLAWIVVVINELPDAFGEEDKFPSMLNLGAITLVCAVALLYLHKGDTTRIDRHADRHMKNATGIVEKAKGGVQEQAEDAEKMLQLAETAVQQLQEENSLLAERVEALTEQRDAYMEQVEQVAQPIVDALSREGGIHEKMVEEITQVEEGLEEAVRADKEEKARLEETTDKLHEVQEATEERAAQLADAVGQVSGVLEKHQEEDAKAEKAVREVAQETEGIREMTDSKARLENAVARAREKTQGLRRRAQEDKKRREEIARKERDLQAQIKIQAAKRRDSVGRFHAMRRGGQASSALSPSRGRRRSTLRVMGDAVGDMFTGIGKKWSLTRAPAPIEQPVPKTNLWGVAWSVVKRRKGGASQPIRSLQGQDSLASAARDEPPPLRDPFSSSGGAGASDAGSCKEMDRITSIGSIPEDHSFRGDPFLEQEGD